MDMVEDGPTSGGFHNLDDLQLSMRNPAKSSAHNESFPYKVHAQMDTVLCDQHALIDLRIRSQGNHCYYAPTMSGQKYLGVYNL